MANFLLHSHYGSRLIMTKIFFQFFGGAPCVWATQMFAGSSDQPRENGFSMRKRSRSCRHRERIAFWNACYSFRKKNCASIPCTDLQRSSRSERTSNVLRKKTPHSLTCRNCPPGRAKPTFFPSASSASVPCACKSPTIGSTGVYGRYLIARGTGCVCWRNAPRAEPPLPPTARRRTPVRAASTAITARPMLSPFHLRTPFTWGNGCS